ncbi:MAG: SDR family oxidoreductase [Spirochaetes bacterium]|jgi:NAD(P)-dependent dehydrogenase (short-subunit alcohol dehydrogenase family)|nr:SDR family oxidoreductase [Spirochaetota bacterium]
MALTVDLSGSVTIVTGVTSGIGAGVAEVFARAGSAVVGCGRRGPESKEAAAFLEAAERNGVPAEYVSCDISDADGPGRVVSAAADRFGRIDFVVSNAGRNVFTGIDESSLTDWQECIDLNLRSHWLLAREVAPHLRAAADDPRAPDGAGPVFMVNTSNHAYATIPGCFPYNVTKAGMTALVQSLAIEWGPQVRAVGVAPGFIETEANRDWFARFDDPQAERRRTEAMHPVGRLGTPEEMGALFAFLASRYAAFITGTTVLADGGRGALMQDAMKDYG